MSLEFGFTQTQNVKVLAILRLHLCVPNMDFGCELSHFSDTFWNAERIRQHLDNPVDVESLVCGIKALSLFDEVI